MFLLRGDLLGGQREVLREDFEPQHGAWYCFRLKTRVSKHAFSKRLPIHIGPALFEKSVNAAEAGGCQCFQRHLPGLEEAEDFVADTHGHRGVGEPGAARRALRRAIRSGGW